MGFLCKIATIVFFVSPLSAAPLAELCQRDNPEMEIISAYGLESVWQSLTSIWQKGAQTELPERKRIEKALLAAKESYLADVAALREISSRILLLGPADRIRLDQVLKNFVAELDEKSNGLELSLERLPLNQKDQLLVEGKAVIKAELMDAYQARVETLLRNGDEAVANVKVVGRKFLSLLPDGPYLRIPEEYLEIHNYVQSLLEATNMFSSFEEKLPNGRLRREIGINEIEDAGLNINIVIRYPKESADQNIKMNLIFSPLPDLENRVSMKLCRPKNRTCRPLPLAEFCEKIVP